MIADLTADDLGRIFGNYLRIRGLDDSNPDELLRNHLDPDAELATGRKARIVLVSSDFGLELTTTVMWLNEVYDFDIRCVRLVPYRHREQLVLDVQQVIPLPEAGDYQVRIRRKAEAAARERTSDGRDFTQYVIVGTDGESAPLRKRWAVLTMVQQVVEAGVTIDQIRAEMLPRYWREVPGEVTGDELAEALAAAYPGIELGRNFTGHPFHEGGKTWVMSRMWGRQTESTLERLRALAPAGSVDFRSVASD